MVFVFVNCFLSFHKVRFILLKGGLNWNHWIWMMRCVFWGLAVHQFAWYFSKTGILRFYVMVRLFISVDTASQETKRLYPLRSFDFAEFVVWFRIVIFFNISFQIFQPFLCFERSKWELIVYSFNLFSFLENCPKNFPEVINYMWNQIARILFNYKFFHV